MFYALYKIADGELFSVTQRHHEAAVLSDRGLARVDLGATAPDQRAVVWDTAAHVFVSRTFDPKTVQTEDIFLAMTAQEKSRFVKRAFLHMLHEPPRNNIMRPPAVQILRRLHELGVLSVPRAQTIRDGLDFV